ncbi:heparan-alpha-glucosaminide N-acetyltransferase domain-containing protein [Buchananella hordeovulneris]|uniref:heparan-alpha-glucosaminide N-acetyltransferase domain-containing protein n=1 Tax=Buchananella hordeovulneris TaxID=52770 RepID=UPI00163A6AE4|nr:heparan-alpha-glucosaminide N-acetyltransferase domain-containing protein [Buchananella hordeovulneris]
MHDFPERDGRRPLSPYDSQTRPAPGLSTDSESNVRAAAAQQPDTRVSVTELLTADEQPEVEMVGAAETEQPLPGPEEGEATAPGKTDTVAAPSAGARPTADEQEELVRAFSAPARRWWPQLRRGAFLGDARRLPGLDAVRGLALAGMMAAHSAKQVEEVTSPTWLGFANGHSSILFATVAGVSLAIITGGGRAHTGPWVVRDRLRIFARAFALFVLGSLMAILGTPIGIILGSYGLWFVLALPFLRCRWQTVLLAASVFLGLGWMLQWAGLLLAGNLDLKFDGQLGNTLFALLFTSQYPAAIWLGFVLAGLALGRAGLGSARTLWRWGLAGAVVFVGCVTPFVWQAGSLEPVWGVSPALVDSVDQSAPTEPECLDGETLYPCTPEEQQQQMDTWTNEQWDTFMRAQRRPPEESVWQLLWGAARSQWTIAPHSGSPFEALGSAGFAVAAICAFTALGRWAKLLAAPLVAMGSMSLSSYCLHVVLMWHFADNFTGETNTPFLMMLGGIAVVTLVWAALFQRGPLEQAMAWFADGAARLPRQARTVPTAAGS